MEKFILGIESSCDDTSVSIIDFKGQILSNIVYSQIKEHSLYSGVVPEIASRSHLDKIDKLLYQALNNANIQLDDINYIAATGGPGLIGGVLVGTVFAKSLSSILSKPYYAINHLEGHVLSVGLNYNVKMPYLCLLVSGGHCMFVLVKEIGKYEILGETLDDSAGEALDKFAKMLGLGYPGGAIIEKLALKGDENKYHFAKPMIHDKSVNMSFSGLKTSARNLLLKINNLEDVLPDLCASFQKTVKDVLCNKLVKAINNIKNNYDINNFVVVGGVASNIYFRQYLEKTAKEYGYNFYVPDKALCTDNAAMIAFAALQRIKSNKPQSNLTFNPRSRWSLEDLN